MAGAPRQGGLISVVVPLFNERANVESLHRRLAASLGGLGVDFEILLVDDGSTDGTAAHIDALRTADPRVKALHLSRNFGHQAAVSAGIDHARGVAVVVMDGDLQDPPEVLPSFIRLWRDDGYEVVYAIRRQRKEGAFKRVAYFAFYRLLRAISDLDIPLDSGDFCLMDRQVVDALRALPERMRFVRGLRTFVGFRQVGLEYERDARAAGRSKYSFRALCGLAVDGLISFSSYPLHLVTYLGLFTAAVAVGLSIWVFADAFASGASPRGWASLIVVVLFLGSVQMVSLGIIGEYIRRIFIESKGRPTYILRDAGLGPGRQGEPHGEEDRVVPTDEGADA